MEQFLFFFSGGAALLLLPLTSAHTYLLKMLLCIFASAAFFFQASSLLKGVALSGYLPLQMPVPDFRVGAIYYYFSYINSPDALLCQDRYGSITGGCKCCVCVGIRTSQKFAKIIHQNQEADEGCPGNGSTVWFNSEPYYGPGSSGFPSF